MALIFICPQKDPAPWQSAIAAVNPEIDFRIWPDEGSPDDVTFALLWNHPPDVLNAYPNLKAISSLGAGIDHINNDATLPEGLAVTRIVDPNLVQSMSEYVVTAALNHFRDFPAYQQQKAQKSWHPLPARHIKDFTVGVMGMGQLGYDAAKKLNAVGFDVVGWSRNPKPYPELKTSFSGEDELPAFLAQSQILVCLLPLTPATEGILNKNLFDLLPHNAYLINVARGAHLVDADLIDAINTDAINTDIINTAQLSGACLDVFNQEPLPPSHPFWTMPQITITPHIASITNPKTAAVQVVENYIRTQAGQPLLHQVDLKRGY